MIVELGPGYHKNDHSNRGLFSENDNLWVEHLLADQERSIIIYHSEFLLITILTSKTSQSIQM